MPDLIAQVVMDGLGEASNPSITQRIFKNRAIKCALRHVKKFWNRIKIFLHALDAITASGIGKKSAGRQRWGKAKAGKAQSWTAARCHAVNVWRTADQERRKAGRPDSGGLTRPQRLAAVKIGVFCCKL